jgi:hypothetical protein
MTEKRNFLIIQDPYNQELRCLYWIIRGGTVTFVVRSITKEGTEDPWLQLHGNLHIQSSAYYAQMFISNISRTILVKHPRVLQFIRWPHIIEYKFPDPGTAQLMSKGFMRSSNVYYSRDEHGKKFVSENLRKDREVN